MDKVAGLPAAQRSELFSESAARRGMTPAIVEKDFWVTWTLDKLFSHHELSRILMFKGGTTFPKYLVSSSVFLKTSIWFWTGLSSPVKTHRRSGREQNSKL